MGTDDGMALTPEFRAIIERWAKNNGVGSGHQYIGCCRICGRPRWQSSKTEGPFGVTIFEDSPGRCDACSYVHQRHPELFAWIIDVIGFRFMREDASASEPRETRINPSSPSGERNGK